MRTTTHSRALLSTATHDTVRDAPVSSRTAGELARITYRQLDYWCRVRIITPTVDTRGSGTARMWSAHGCSLLAVLGRLSMLPDPDTYDSAHEFCDLLIVGAGPAGLSAALTAGRAGMRVFLAESGHGLVHESHCPPGVEDLFRRQCLERFFLVVAILGVL